MIIHQLVLVMMTRPDVLWPAWSSLSKNLIPLIEEALAAILVLQLF